jgi:hypothetical protein|tara:strand:+ start:208 stop:405 length:198 start_codon:yes stop_codon:yes gene_type:complete
MTTKPSDIARQLAEASPAHAATLWTTIAEDKTLAIKVHDALGSAGRVELAHKLGELSDKSTKNPF